MFRQELLIFFRKLILLGILLTSGVYVLISLEARRLIPLQDMGNLIRILSWATLFHSHENGGLRAFQIIANALSNQALSETLISVDSTQHILPLPPYTILESCDLIISGLPHGLQSKFPYASPPLSCRKGAKFPSERKFFLSVNDAKSTQRYFKVVLPEAGWKFEDQLGAVVIYKQGYQKLFINRGYYLTDGIFEFTISTSSLSSKRSTKIIQK